MFSMREILEEFVEAGRTLVDRSSEYNYRLLRNGLVRAEGARDRARRWHRLNRSYKRAKQLAYSRSPEGLAARRAYERTPERRAAAARYASEYNRRPEVKAKKNERAKRRFASPEAKAERKLRQQEWYKRPEVIARRKERRRKK